MIVIKEYLQLFGMGMISVLLTVFLYILDSKQKFNKINPRTKSIIIGVLFGCVAIINTDFGVHYTKFVLNARDVAPVCAGLIFGPTAGIIAGTLGAVERYFAVFWGVGKYTQLACTFGTLIAGLLGAGLRQLMFKETRPKWYYGLFIGFNAEIIHMSLVFVTHPSEIRTDYEIVTYCGIPMIIVNGVCVALACGIIYALDAFHREKTKYPTISTVFQSITVLCIVSALVVSIGSTTFMQISLMKSDSKETLVNNVNDVIDDIGEISDRCIVETTENAEKSIETQNEMSSKLIKKIAALHSISELNIIDKYGTIRYSTKDSKVGYNLYGDDLSFEFMNGVRTNDYIITDEYSGDDYYAVNSTDVIIKYCGMTLNDGWIIQAGFDNQCLRQITSNDIDTIANHRRIGKSGWVMVLDTSSMIVSSGKGQSGIHSTVAGIHSSESIEPGKLLEATVYDEECYATYGYSEGYFIIALIPKEEAEFNTNLFIVMIVYMEMLLLGVMFINIVFIVEKKVVQNVHKFNAGFNKITSGELDVEIEEIKIEEFSELAADANATVLKLKTLIDEAAEKVASELKFASSIQEGALERVFPPFPDDKRFDIHCTMTPAKEVGGDFYDFFFVDENTFAFLVADVSGKGIPAAMFMMTAKTLIKSMGRSGVPVNQIMYQANQELCRHNEAGMFVTCWMGIIKLDSGHVTYTCAGHNPPLLKRKGGNFEYFKGKVNLVLAAMEDVPDDINEFELEKGDEIFLYTDGVTEATNKDNELYGEERLENILNLKKPAAANDVCVSVKEDIDRFVGEADQFDDITMLSFKYGCKPNTNIVMKEKIIEEKTIKKEVSPGKVQFIVFEEDDVEEFVIGGKENDVEEFVIGGKENDVEEFVIGGKENDVEEFVIGEKNDDVEEFVIGSKKTPNEKPEEIEEFVFDIKKDTKRTFSNAENEFTMDAITDNVPLFTQFIDEKLEAIDCPIKTQMKIDIAVDEILSNISFYAYSPDVGPATIKFELSEDSNTVILSFIDSGVPYNPLKKDDPDTGLSLEERGIGGLGIFMVKQSMDDMIYEYKDGQNILTIKKSILE